MSGRLRGKRVAILIEEGFDGREVTDPMAALREEGAETVLVGASAAAHYRDRNGGTTVTASLAASAARVQDFDAIVIPGGFAPDRMRMRHAMVDLAAAAMAANKPVAAICRGAQVLISADAIRGRTLTCWPSIAVDVKNAGGLYVDRPVVRDGNLITSRKADDLAEFAAALIDALLTS
jgi:protease I